jgi:ditrans,polycis-polyprenyl diphosphate synthase
MEIEDGQKNHHLDNKEGHVIGYNRLEETLDWCEKLGVKSITVFAFSIENFKRTETEVTALMKLAEEKFTKMLHKNSSLLDKHQCAVKLLGKWELLPDYVKEAATKVINYSAKYNQMYMNFCFPYTSTEEITQAVQNVVIKQIKSSESLTLEQVLDQLEQNMYTKHSSPVDLVIRTSGEIRLSDFLTWQSSSSAMYSFKEVMWPDFSLWNLFSTVLSYQRTYHRIKEYKQRMKEIGQIK